MFGFSEENTETIQQRMLFENMYYLFYREWENLREVQKYNLEIKTYLTELKYVMMTKKR